MDEKTNELIAYVNGEWSQTVSQANNKIAHLILEVKTLQEENRALKSEINKLKDSGK